MRAHSTIISFLGHNFDNVDCGLKFTMNFDGTSQMKIRLSGILGRLVIIDWGNNTKKYVRFDNHTYMDIYSEYETNGTYEVSITGSCDALTFVQVIDQPNVTAHLSTNIPCSQLAGIDFRNINVDGDLDNISNLTTIEFIRINDSNLLGNISVFSNKSNLSFVDLEGCNIDGDIAVFTTTNIKYLNLAHTSASGDVGSLNSCTSIEKIDLNHTSITGDLSHLIGSKNIYYIDVNNTGATFDTYTTTYELIKDYVFLAYDCNWTTDMVNTSLQTIADSTRHSGSIDISGNNQARSSASDTAYNSLIANGTNIKVN